MKTKLLIADDDLFEAMYLTKVFEDEGFETARANDGREAMDIMSRGTFDVLLTDILMPGADGLELIRYARETSPSTKILAMSSGGRGGPRIPLHAAQIFGADLSFEKPVDDAAVVRSVRHLLLAAADGQGPSAVVDGAANDDEDDGSIAAVHEYLTHVGKRSTAAEGQPPRVLVVEDSEGEARLIELELRRDAAIPLHVTWTTRLANAERQLRERHVDLVVLDLTLPDSAGLETLRRFREVAPSLPLIVRSGNGHLATPALNEGAFSFIEKTVGMDGGLAKAITKALATARSKPSRT